MLLRLIVAVNLTIGGVCALFASGGPTFLIGSIAVLSIAVGIALLAGFLTPLAGMLAATGYLGAVVCSLLKMEASGHAEIGAALNLAAISIALALLGPGAFSVDARIFGRREIIIPDGPKTHRQ